MNWIQNIVCSLFRIDTAPKILTNSIIVEKEVIKELPQISPTFHFEVKEIIKEVIVKVPEIITIEKEVVVEKGVSLESLDLVNTVQKLQFEEILKKIDDRTFIREIEVEKIKIVEKIVERLVPIYEVYESPIQAIIANWLSIYNDPEFDYKTLASQVNEISTIIYRHGSTVDTYDKQLMVDAMKAWLGKLPTPNEYKAKFR